MAQTGGVKVELIKMLVPVGTFILGIIFALCYDFFKARRELKNIKSILGRELAENHRKLKHLISTDKDGKSNIGNLLSVPDQLSHSVYDRYLDKLCKLKNQEIRDIYDAYDKIRSAVIIAEMDGPRFLTSEFENNRKIAAGHITENCVIALDAIEKALKHFPREMKSIKAIETGHGL